MKIHRLSEEIVKRIAAGEVVERPASVVKELIENALDAGARHIEGLVKGAGRLIIRMADDGCGMEKDDLALALDRHTTSKIREVEDIDRIESLGFRGEALYSIAAVSRMEISSRSASDPVAHRLASEGGRVLEFGECAGAVGTVVEVRDLFWNTPARLKFLKSPNTEMRHIFETMALYGLARPEVAFRLKGEDRVLMDLEGPQDLEARIQSLYKALGRDWIGVQAEFDSARIQGYLGHPKMARADRSFQFFFVNGRPVKSVALSYALEAAFHSLLPDGKHPVAFLFLELDPQKTDVNVHPTKREIRFHHAQEMQDSVREAVRRALSSEFSSKGPATTWGDESRADRVKDSIATYFESRKNIALSNAHGKFGVTVPSFGPRANQEVLQTLADKKKPFRVLGSFDELYWVIQWPDGLGLMDQHAAHERVLYERFLRSWRSQKIEVQPLLLPVTFELSREDHSLAREYHATLENLGFGIEEFGPSAILINQVSAYCQTHDLQRLLLEILDDLKTWRKTESVGERGLEERIILAACKSAVKAHDAMNMEEIERLIEDLLGSELPYTCPHGRPTLIKFTGNDLAKMFKRR